MHFKPESIKEFTVFFEIKKGLIASFPGCQHVELLIDKGQPDVLYTYSIWDGEDSLEAYRQSELFLSVWKATKTHFLSPAKAWSMDLLAEAGLES
jgi:heme-degrading monooxygenase HmoA